MLLAKFDALDPEVLLDPYPTYARLRAAGPVCRVPPASLGVTHHRYVAELLRDRRLGNDFPDDNPAFAVSDSASGQVFRRIIPTQDADEHSKLHRLMVAAFSPRTARGYAGRIRAIVEGCLEPALATGRLDVAAQFAFPVAMSVVCELIGLPTEQRAAMWARADALSKAFTPFLPEPDRPVADEALAWMRQYIADVVAQRRGVRGTDLVSRMLAAQEGEATLTDDEIVDNVAFLCFTGFETTMNMISTGCLALAGFPDQYERLRADRSLLPTAIEEFVRLDTPIQYTARVTREEVTIGDRTIRAGRSVLLMLGCANHDERVFHEPSKLDVGRDPNPHVGFGGGVRGCLGAALARVEGRVAFDVLLDRIARLEPAEPVQRRTSALFRGYASMPLAVKPA